MVGTILAIVLFSYIIVGTYLQILPEKPEIIEARKRYGKAK